MNFKFALPALAVAAAFAAPVAAAVPVVSPKGVENADTYSFYATSTGPLIAYNLGGISVSYKSKLYVSINGGDWLGGVFLTGSGTEGTSYNFGSVAAGDVITFKLRLTSPANVAGGEIFSDAALNSDGLNHVFSSSWSGGEYTYQHYRSGPIVTDYLTPGNYQYVAFEDILGNPDPNFANDFDYNDQRFAFLNVRTVVPEPATWAMMITGFGLVGFAMRRRKASLSSVAA